MLVGEQPGDKEDLAGKPFVGPAGQMLDRALEEAGIDRKKVYVTNAVKHFKFVPRGKIRLHQKPNTPEIKACRQWYEHELATIKPDLVVAMGATAAQCVFNKIMPINRNRGSPDRPRRRRQGAGDGASIVSFAAARCGGQGTGVSAFCRRPEDRGTAAAEAGAGRLKSGVRQNCTFP
jgi:uracil-DNA glycosylase